MERNLDRAHAISDYRFPTVDIRKTATTQDEEVTEEDVAEIFVRINNQGTRLGQADFVLTLLSVLSRRVTRPDRGARAGNVPGHSRWDRYTTASAGCVRRRLWSRANVSRLPLSSRRRSDDGRSGHRQTLETSGPTRRCGEGMHGAHAVARLLASREACWVRQPGARRLQERNRERLCLLHPRPEGRSPEEQTRRDDRALGVRVVAYGTLFGLVGDHL